MLIYFVEISIVFVHIVVNVG